MNFAGDVGTKERLGHRYERSCVQKALVARKGCGARGRGGTRAEAIRDPLCADFDANGYGDILARCGDAWWVMTRLALLLPISADYLEP